MATLTPEVAVTWETMTCRAMRNHYESTRHDCRWFNSFGRFHAYDVATEASLSDAAGIPTGLYVGKRYRVPELLSGCRKAPIMSVGLNPNLAGVRDKKRIYPYFDDIRQFAEHFRFRTNFKYSIEDNTYEDNLVSGNGYARFNRGESIPLEKEYVRMYNEYGNILQRFEQDVGIVAGSLSLGEDVSYYNFVACHSPRWDADAETEEGIVEECFSKRQFFLRQLWQSDPKVIIMFGKAVMRSFIEFVESKFEDTDLPDPDDTYKNILANNNYTISQSGKRIRVIFSPHPTGAGAYYSRTGARNKIVQALKDEYNAGNLSYNAGINHLERTDGACSFCDNSVFQIGDCPYGK